jgi:hypothetical protein
MSCKKISSYRQPQIVNDITLIVDATKCQRQKPQKNQVYLYLE